MNKFNGVVVGGHTVVKASLIQSVGTSKKNQ